jgi:hypothetical protein
MLFVPYGVVLAARADAPAFLRERDGSVLKSSPLTKIGEMFDP